MTAHNFKWVEYRPRPKKEGLHDSGYRFLDVYGIEADGTRVPISGYADHIWIRAPGANLDVTPEGVHRVALLEGCLVWDGFSGSSVVLTAAGSCATGGR